MFTEGLAMKIDLNTLAAQIRAAHVGIRCKLPLLTSRQISQLTELLADTAQ